ncbi:hypothetical protein NVP1177O_04 [Vibrio phage 1.177.O._10N.286.45.E10]|nr:hypothetical protein NVP1177O_04 [Vibrio phage 1.177.O._10N.286.45.E10]
MSNVIKMFEDESKGYIMNDNNIVGVYVDGLASISDGDFVSVGQKCNDGIDNTVSLSVSDMNEFCLMWLLVFNPKVIAEG